jgi:hypothetical protein
MLNELNVIERALVFARNGSSRVEAAVRAEATQTSTLLRVWIGKLWGAYEAYGKHLQRQPTIGNTYMPRLKADAAKAKEALKSHFRNRSVLEYVRHITVHAFEGDQIEEAFNKLCRDSYWLTCLADITANFISLSTEDLFMESVRMQMGKSSINDALQALIDLTLKAADDLRIVLLALYHEILSANFPRANSVNWVKVPNAQGRGEIGVPFFLLPDDAPR